MYMLDTNICVYLIKHNPLQVRAQFEKRQPGDVFLSSIVLAELMYGISKSQHQERNRAALEMFLMPLDVVPFDEHVAGLERSGQVIGGNDLFIAVHALSLNVTLVSNDLKAFSGVPRLRLENWV